MKNIRKIILCRGIQASGKSTWAKQWVLEDPEHRVRFNNDDIRNMYGKYWVPSREHLVTEAKRNFAYEATSRGYDIVVDNMNLNPKEVAWWGDIVEITNNTTDYHYTIEFKDFFIPVEECIRRDAMRANPMGEKVIKDTWKRYKSFIIQENIKKFAEKKLEQKKGLPLAVIVDMDGTICLNTTGRPFYGPGAAEGMEEDTPINEIITLVRGFCDATNAQLIVVTGREDTPEIRKATLEWCDRYWLCPDYLYMRPVGNYSPVEVCKKSIFEESIKDNFYVMAVLDDSQKCVDMWRDLGLICLQPNNGNF